MNSNSNNLDDDSDARIDAMARAAGGELRRPAPAEGLARAHAVQRRRQTVRAVTAGASAVALLGAGVFALTRGDDDQRLVPVDTTVETSLPSSTVETSTTSIPPNAAGDPEVVYSTTGFILNPDYLQTVIDPVTGNVLRTETPDGVASSDAQAALVDAFVLDGRVEVPPVPALAYRFESGDFAYGYSVLPSEHPGLQDQEPEALPLFDRCGQSELTVEGASASVLPARVHSVVMSLDRRWLATISSECPVAGTLEGQTKVLPAPTTWQVFDARRPDLPGRTLNAAGSVFFSPDGDYLAFVQNRSYTVFDLGDGSQVAVAPSNCGLVGGRYAADAGPWVGDSSLVAAINCPGEPASMVVIDVATGEQLRVAAPAGANLPGSSVDGPYLTVEVDAAHYERPQNAWFTICASSAEASSCWYGQGNTEPVEILGAREASFLPLGFTPGG
jgi:hypothetical protein